MTVAHNVLRNLNGYLSACDGRVLRLFACALARAVWHRLNDRERYAVVYTETIAEGLPVPQTGTNLGTENWTYAWSVLTMEPGHERRPFFPLVRECLCPSAPAGAYGAAGAFLGCLAQLPRAVDTRLNNRYQEWRLREDNRLAKFYKSLDNDFKEPPPGEPEPLRPYQRIERRMTAACRILESYGDCIIFPRGDGTRAGDVAGMLPNPELGPHQVPHWLPGVCEHDDGRIRKMAQQVYVKRAWHNMPILADAVEEAGCPNLRLLEHCRRGRVHGRGCWALDVLLGLTEPECAPAGDM